jgi:hypothetical protein
MNVRGSSASAMPSLKYHFHNPHHAALTFYHGMEGDGIERNSPVV